MSFTVSLCNYLKKLEAKLSPDYKQLLSYLLRQIPDAEVARIGSTSSSSQGGTAFTTTFPFQTSTLHGGRAFTTTFPFQTSTFHGGRAFTTTFPFQTPTLHGGRAFTTSLSRTPTLHGFHREFHSGDIPRDTDTKSTQDFYYQHLAPKLYKYYLKMSDPNSPTSSNSEWYFITVDDFVDLALRYPMRKFEDEFWQQITHKRIIVADSKAKYPPWFKPMGLLPLVLKQPIQVIPYSLPGKDWPIYYTDGSPHHNRNQPGGGGIIRVRNLGSELEITLYGVLVEPNSAFVTEGTVQNCAINHATMEGCVNATFVSDSQDTTDTKMGRSFFQEDYKEFSRVGVVYLSKLSEYECQFKPREAMALCDAIAREVKKRGMKFGKFREVIVMEVLPKESQKLKKTFEKRAPVIRIEYLPEHEVVGHTAEEIEAKQRRSPKFVDPYYTYRRILFPKV